MAGWVEFPRLTPAGKQLMESVAGLMDSELGSSLRPSQTAADVRSFKGDNGEGSVTLRAGQDGSKVRSFALPQLLFSLPQLGHFELASNWLHLIKLVIEDLLLKVCCFTQ